MNYFPSYAIVSDHEVMIHFLRKKSEIDSFAPVLVMRNTNNYDLSMRSGARWVVSGSYNFALGNVSIKLSWVKCHV